MLAQLHLFGEFVTIYKLEEICDGGFSMLDFIRVASAVPPVAVGDTVKNAADICRYIRQADKAGCDLVVFFRQ